jgi:antitoxin component of MazEF toxin-antitoxin module
VIKTQQTEKRKIVRIGKTSLGVILPRAWLRYFSINAGDQVQLVINNQIRIKPTPNKAAEAPT